MVKCFYAVIQCLQGCEKMDMNEDMITLFLDKIGHQKLKDVFYKMNQDFAIGREHSGK